MQEINLNVRVMVGGSDITPDTVAALVARLIGCGIEDAQATLRDGDCALEDDRAEAVLATHLEVHVTPQQKPRVLVVVAGGIAEHVCDDDVDVAIFDRDNYADDPTNAHLPAKSFADLAATVNVPVGAA